MTKTLVIPASRDIMAARQAICKSWSERERHRRRKMAARKQQTLLNLLASSVPSTAARVA
jgi:hypothetical protein